MSWMGVDLSSAQSGLTQDHFATMSQSMSFCIIQNYIGNDGQSANYNQFKSYAVNAGLKVLPYNFVYCFPDAAGHINRSGADQAKLHYSTCNSIACLDLEFPVVGDWPKWNVPDGYFIVDWINEYQETYKSLSGEYCILYSYPDYLSNLGDISSFAAYKLWLARYDITAPLPPIPSPWTSNDLVLWQYSNSGVLPNGVVVDQDYCFDFSIFD
jgi:GH25 family lysozyme M1 (1,4-beta-N-acetylmuramidase)